MQPDVTVVGGSGLPQVALKLLTDVKATDSLVYFSLL